MQLHWLFIFAHFYQMPLTLGSSVETAYINLIVSK